MWHKNMPPNCILCILKKVRVFLRTAILRMKYRKIIKNWFDNESGCKCNLQNFNIIQITHKEDGKAKKVSQNQNNYVLLCKAKIYIFQGTKFFFNPICHDLLGPDRFPGLALNLPTGTELGINRLKDTKRSCGPFYSTTNSTEGPRSFLANIVAFLLQAI